MSHKMHLVMYTFLFLMSLAYISYNLYHVAKKSVPVWLEKRIRASTQNISFEGLNNKRWDTRIGALSKTFTCSVLLTSFMVFTYLVGYETMLMNNILVFAVLLTAIGLACLTHWNMERWLKRVS